MNGILLIDKPRGISSFGVVAKVRGIWRAQLREQGESIKKAKVGHTGTLDPLATGLLVLVLGDYCKRASEFTKLDKTYEVEMILGKTSTTGDEEGEKTVVSTREPSAEEVNGIVKSFIGEQQQVPHAYSAVKVNGQRAYDLARKGKEVTLEPRLITVYDIREVTYDYPRVAFTCDVSSGTYIRSLVEDIGKALSVGAYMSGLARTRVGQFLLTEAAQLKTLTTESVKALVKQIEI